MTVAQPGPGGRRVVAYARAFREPLSVERRHILLSMLDRPWIVSRSVIGQTQDDTCPSLQADMPECGSQGQDALAGGDGAVHLACYPEIGAHGGVDLPEPPLVAERLGQGLGVT